VHGSRRSGQRTVRDRSCCGWRLYALGVCSRHVAVRVRAAISVSGALAPNGRGRRALGCAAAHEPCGKAQVTNSRQPDENLPSAWGRHQHLARHGGSHGWFAFNEHTRANSAHGGCRHDRPTAHLRTTAALARSRPDAVLGPVESPPCMRQRLASVPSCLRQTCASHGAPPFDRHRAMQRGRSLQRADEVLNRSGHALTMSWHPMSRTRAPVGESSD